MVEAISLIVIFALVLIVFSTRRNNSRGSRRTFYQSRREYYDEPTDGESFEELIEQKLSKLEKVGAKVIRNCYLRRNNGTTTQIDDILVFRSGIYVIECKDYSGGIFGDGNRENWTQTLPYGWNGDSIKTSFYNPIKQNQSHIQCIRQKLLNDNSIPIHNIVVFGDKCTFKSIENTMGAHVIKVERLYEVVYRIEQETVQRLSESEIENIYVRLMQDVSENPSIDNEHIRNVNRIKMQKRKEECSTGYTCPRCGSPLVLRDGQYGRFYGCMRYPSCKYTRTIKSLVFGLKTWSLFSCGEGRFDRDFLLFKKKVAH